MTGSTVSFYDTKAQAQAGGTDRPGRPHERRRRHGPRPHGGRRGHRLEGRQRPVEQQPARRRSGQVAQRRCRFRHQDDSGTADPATGLRTLTPGTATCRGVAVTATNRDDIATYSVGIGGGTVGVAVAAAVNVVNADTQAYIGQDASVNADQTGATTNQSVLVAAGNDFHHVALAAGAGFGAVGVAPGVDVTVIGNTTGPTSGPGRTWTRSATSGSTRIATEDVVMVGLGIAAGTVGVGGGVSVLTSATRRTRRSPATCRRAGTRRCRRRTRPTSWSSAAASGPGSWASGPRWA